MSEVTIIKTETGQLAGFGEKGDRAYRKWIKQVKEMAVGQTLHFSWKAPRSPRHHRLFFAKLGALMDRQEQFADEDDLRKWLTVGAGECRFVPGPTGRMVALPKSIAWHKLDEADFSELHRKVDSFLLSAHARAFLWPHLSDEQSFAAVEELLDEFSK